MSGKSWACRSRNARSPPSDQNTRFCKACLAHGRARQPVRSPITATATPVSAAAAKQQHQDKNDQDQFHNKSPLLATALFAAHRIFQAADRVLHLAGSLVGLAFGFQLLVAENLPGSFFHGSLGLLGRAFDAIFIHCRFLDVGWVSDNGWRRCFVPDSVGCMRALRPSCALSRAILHGLYRADSSAILTVERRLISTSPSDTPME